MDSILTEIIKKIRNSFYWLTLILALQVIELIPGVGFQTENPSRSFLFSDESAKRDILLASSRENINRLEKRWNCDCSYFDINFNKDYEEHKVKHVHQDTVCLDIMNQILTEKRYLNGTSIPADKEIGKSVPFFDLKFSATLYPLVLKGLIIYFLIMILFRTIELSNILKLHSKKAIPTINNQLLIEDKIHFPSMHFLLAKGISTLSLFIFLILFFQIFLESENYFCTYALTAELINAKISLGILNLILFIAIPIIAFFINKKYSWVSKQIKLIPKIK